jgi:ABC-2 type transport system ATP-binding protein
MRGDFAAALLHDPQIVYLDEPTIGLDVVAKEAIREFVAAMNRDRGTTVMLTTHDLADVERLCRRVILIDRGTVIFDGPLEHLRDRFGTHRVLVVNLAETCDDLKVEGAETFVREGMTVRYRFDRHRISAEALIRRVAEKCIISDVAIVEPDIESIVRRIYLEGFDEAAVAEIVR